MDAPTKTKDALQKSGQPSEVEQKGPSTPPEMITKDQAEKLADEKHSKLDKEIARLTKVNEAVIKRVEDAEAKELERQRERDEAAIRDADGDPVKLTALQRQKSFRDEQTTHTKAVAEHEKEKATWQERIEKVEAAELKSDIKEIAEKNKVDLKQLTDSLPEGVKELKAIEGIAKAIANAKPFEPDSGNTVGGGDGDMSAKGKVTRALSRMKK